MTSNAEIRAWLNKTDDPDAKLENLIQNSELLKLMAKDRKIIETLMIGNNKLDQGELPNIKGNNDKGEDLNSEDFYDFACQKVKAIMNLSENLITTVIKIKDSI
jgi:hypothetical protein